MTYGKFYSLSAGRLLPVAGGPAISPPSTGDGGGSPGGPVGDRNAMLVGAAIDDLSGAAFDAAAAAAGPWTVRRSYEDPSVGFPFTSWASCRGGVDVGKRASVWTCKPDIVKLAAGDFDAAITAFVRTIPDTHVAFLGCWHEVDGKIRQGTKDASQNTITLPLWLDAARHFYAAVHAAGKAHVYTTMIVEAWTGQHPQPGSTYAEIWPGDGLVDVWGVDGYSNTGDGASLWGPAITFAQGKDVPWGIAEIGCAGTLDTAWMSRQATYAASHGAGGAHAGAAWFCWFDTDVGGVIPTPGTDPAAQATAQTIAQTYFANYSTYLL